MPEGLPAADQIINENQLIPIRKIFDRERGMVVIVRSLANHDQLLFHDMGKNDPEHT